MYNRFAKSFEIYEFYKLIYCSIYSTQQQKSQIEKNIN